MQLGKAVQVFPSELGTGYAHYTGAKFAEFVTDLESLGILGADQKRGYRVHYVTKLGCHLVNLGNSPMMRIWGHAGVYTLNLFFQFLCYS